MFFTLTYNPCFSLFVAKDIVLSVLSALSLSTEQTLSHTTLISSSSKNETLTPKTTIVPSCKNDEKRSNALGKTITSTCPLVSSMSTNAIMLLVLVDFIFTLDMIAKILTLSLFFTL